jgi:hypothetical protein
LVFCRSDGSRPSQTWLDEQHRNVRTALKLSAGFVLQPCGIPLVLGSARQVQTHLLS